MSLTRLLFHEHDQDETFFNVFHPRQKKNPNTLF